MIKHLVAPLIFTSLILTGCQSPQGKFTPEQVAAMQSYGFTESAGDLLRSKLSLRGLAASKY